MQVFHFFSVLTLFFVASCSAADKQTIDPTGNWQFEKAADYAGGRILPHRYDTIQIVAGKLVLSPQCAVPLQREDYTFAGTFQLLMKSGVSSNQLNKFVQKNFSLDMAAVRDVYLANETECSKPFTELLVLKDHLIVTYASTLFYSFRRVQPGSSEATPLIKQKFSSLPFSIAAYRSGCEIPTLKKIPQATTKCAPSYYPYVAAKAETDNLARLIGSNNYAVGRLKTNTEYNNPIKNGLNLVYLVFPPFGDLLLVRVDDLESGEDSDPMAGVYLAIKNGKVSDQLDFGCNFTNKYVCVDEAGHEQARLLPSGKFSKKEVIW